MQEFYSPAVLRIIEHATIVRCAIDSSEQAELNPADLLDALIAEEEIEAIRLIERFVDNLDAFQQDRIRVQQILQNSSVLNTEDMDGSKLVHSSLTKTLLRKCVEQATADSRLDTVDTTMLLAEILDSMDCTKEWLPKQNIGKLIAEIRSSLEAEPLRIEMEDLRDLSSNQTVHKDLVDSIRIIDANMNRASEGLRVLEEYARFSLEQPKLTAELKKLRHDLKECGDWIPYDWKRLCRETNSDVGTTISTNSERFRNSIADVVKANLARVQQSLRSMEEYGKTVSDRFSSGIEQLRYRMYTIDRLLTVSCRSNSHFKQRAIYWLITPSQLERSVDWTVKQAIEGGVSAIQLREKNRSDRIILETAKRIRDICRDHNVLFFLNDRPDLAAVTQADGVHLGQDDLSVRHARKIVGPDAIIGVSTHTPDQLQEAIVYGADYVGAGPVFVSQTKDFDELAGLNYLEYANRESTVPVFAIGGIDLTNVDQVLERKSEHIAVSSYLSRSDDPASAAKSLLDRIMASNCQ